MPSKTSYFNKGIFFNNIKRFWLITFSYTFFLFLFTAGFLSSEIIRFHNNTDLDFVAGRNIFGQSNDFMTLFLGFYPLVAALAVFCYMQFQKNTAMVHSLPVRRETLFVTNYMSGLFIAAFPVIFNSLILLITEAAAGFPSLGYAWTWFGMNLILTFLLYTFAVFAGMFTGHMAAHAIFFYIFNFLAIFLESIINSILGNFLFGYVRASRGSLLFEVLSPLFYVNGLFSGFANNKGNVPALAGYLAAGLVFLAASCLLYRKRHMEVATDVISLPVVKPIFKYSVAVCSSALLGTIMVSILNIGHSLAAYIITYLIGGFIGYFASEMLLRKTFRVFNAYKGYVVFGIILALLLCSINFDLFGYERYVPQDSDVELMVVSTYSDQIGRLALRPEDYDPHKDRYVLFSYREPNGEVPEVLTDAHIKEIRKHQGVLENREAITKARQIHDYIVKNEQLFKNNEQAVVTDNTQNVLKFRSLYFAYRLSDGSLVERQYNLRTYKDNTELDKLLREYLSIPLVREKYEPALGKTEKDIHSITIHYITKNGQSNSYEITENIQDFLSVYQKDIMAQDPLESMYRTSEDRLYDIDVSFEFEDSNFYSIIEPHYSRPLYSNYENTMNYLTEKGVLNPDQLQESDYQSKYAPAARTYK